MDSLKKLIFVGLLTDRSLCHGLGVDDVILVHCLSNVSTLQNLFGTWAEVRFDDDHALDEAFQFGRVSVGWLLEMAFADALEQSIHVLGSERWMQSQCFVQHAAE